MNTNIPELQGANIRYMSRCDVESGESIPTRQDIADYADGLVDPRRINADDSYQYRGFDESLTLSREHGYPTHLGTSPRFHASNASNAKKK